jgi:hypothetical protein
MLTSTSRPIWASFASSHWLNTSMQRLLQAGKQRARSSARSCCFALVQCQWACAGDGLDLDTAVQHVQEKITDGNNIGGSGQRWGWK